MSTISKSSQQVRVQKRSDAQDDTNRSAVTHLLIMDRNFTEEHIQDRLAYADQALRDPKRKLSPIGTRAMKLYEKACIRLLDLEGGEICEDYDKEYLEKIKTEWKSTIRTFD